MPERRIGDKTSLCFRWEGERVSGRSTQSSTAAHHRLQDLPAEEVLGRPRARHHDLRRLQRQGGPAGRLPGETVTENVCRVGFLWANERAAVSGRLWRPPAVPAGAGPLGGARRGELRPHRLHRGEQAQRFYPHCCLRPLDRGDADQGFLPALTGRLFMVRCHGDGAFQCSVFTGCAVHSWQH